MGDRLRPGLDRRDSRASRAAPHALPQRAGGHGHVPVLPDRHLVGPSHRRRRHDHRDARPVLGSPGPFVGGASRRRPGAAGHRRRRPAARALLELGADPVRRRDRALRRPGGPARRALVRGGPAHRPRSGYIRWRRDLGSPAPGRPAARLDVHTGHPAALRRPPDVHPPGRRADDDRGRTAGADGAQSRHRLRRRGRPAERRRRRAALAARHVPGAARRRGPVLEDVGDPARGAAVVDLRPRVPVHHRHRRGRLRHRQLRDRRPQRPLRLHRLHRPCLTTWYRLYRLISLSQIPIVVGQPSERFDGSGEHFLE
ncbi:hypothetical protein FRACA_1110015 [Frankia canadensis]|uniref:Uncharacterized protein n=1 Tax=Frankia canadensis TaxID=1836972 RepID=A0A2I2KJE0_9ACTN|nr:hypothetical protein FRACA_1110015 [Frankia canadensis]SOU53068.1 hypothetical protein FRACA_1110015 [Frankia canadensis]